MIQSLSSPLTRQKPAPTARPELPEQGPAPEVDNVEISGSSGISPGKVALAGVGLLSVFAPMTQAQAAQVQVKHHHNPRQKQVNSEFRRLLKAYQEVEKEMAAEKAADAAIPRVAPEPKTTYILPGTSRLELYSPKQASPFDTDMSVDLGRGLVMDAQGKLSVLLQSGGEISDFRQLENSDGGYLTSHVEHKGNTYRFEGPGDKKINISKSQYGTSIKSRDGHIAISNGGGPSVFINGRHGDQQLQYRVDWKGNQATVTLPNHETVVVTLENEEAAVTRNGQTKNYAITSRHVIPQDRKITVDQQFKVSTGNKEFEKLKARLDAAEPGFTESHPVTVAVMEYAMKNADFADLVKTQKALKPLEVAVPAASALTGVEVGLALTGQAQALKLGAQAMQFKGAALGLAKEAYAAKAGAEAAMHAGNLPQAMALGQKAQSLAGQAQALGGQAKSVGANAMRIGEKAKHAAHVAKTASIVGGAMAIVDGLWTGYEGFKEIDAVEGAMKVAAAKLQETAELESPETFAQAKADFERVSPILLKLARHADTTLNIGGVKVGCGALTLASAFMSGPVAPVVAGAVGSACYLGTAIYDHYRD